MHYRSILVDLIKRRIRDLICVHFPVCFNRRIFDICFPEAERDGDIVAHVLVQRPEMKRKLRCLSVYHLYAADFLIMFFLFSFFDLTASAFDIFYFNSVHKWIILSWDSELRCALPTWLYPVTWFSLFWLPTCIYGHAVDNSVFLKYWHYLLSLLFSLFFFRIAAHFLHSCDLRDSRTFYFCVIKWAWTWPPGPITSEATL